MEWNFVWRWRHWRWPWIHTIPSSSFIHLKMRTSKLLRWEQLLNRLVDLGEILYGGDGIEDDLDSILLNPVTSTVPKRRTFKLLRCYKFWTDRWILMEFCIEVMALKMMSITSNWQTFKLLRRANVLNGLVHLDEILCGGDGIQITSMPYFLIPYLQAFQNDTFKLLRWMQKPPDNVWTGWWILMKFYMEVMTLKVTSITPNG
jgi:hypothetical protein